MFPFNFWLPGFVHNFIMFHGFVVMKGLLVLVNISGMAATGKYNSINKRTKE